MIFSSDNFSTTSNTFSTFSEKVLRRIYIYAKSTVRRVLNHRRPGKKSKIALGGRQNEKWDLSFVYKAQTQPLPGVYIYTPNDGFFVEAIHIGGPTLRKPFKNKGKFKVFPKVCFRIYIYARCPVEKTLYFQCFFIESSKKISFLGVSLALRRIRNP